VGRNPIDSSEWLEGGTGGITITPSGRLYAGASGWSPWLVSKKKVVTPNATTHAVEIICDVWSAGLMNGFNAINIDPASYAGWADPPHRFGALCVGEGVAGMNKMVLTLNGSSVLNVGDTTPPHP
jgi:hypothetical protein